MREAAGTTGGDPHMVGCLPKANTKPTIKIITRGCPCKMCGHQDDEPDPVDPTTTRAWAKSKDGPSESSMVLALITEWVACYYCMRTFLGRYQVSKGDFMGLL